MDGPNRHAELVRDGSRTYPFNLGLKPFALGGQRLNQRHVLKRQCLLASAALDNDPVRDAHVRCSGRKYRFTTSRVLWSSPRWKSRAPTRPCSRRFASTALTCCTLPPNDNASSRAVAGPLPSSRNTFCVLIAACFISILFLNQSKSFRVQHRVRPVHTAQRQKFDELWVKVGLDSTIDDPMAPVAREGCARIWRLLSATSDVPVAKVREYRRLDPPVAVARNMDRAFFASGCASNWRTLWTRAAHG